MKTFWHFALLLNVLEFEAHCSQVFLELKQITILEAFALIQNCLFHILLTKMLFPVELIWKNKIVNAVPILKCKYY